jgi:fucose permease
MLISTSKDACFNAFMGVMANANEMLGFLHGFYGLGATIAPLIATTMITKANLPWYAWFYVMVCLPSLNTSSQQSLIILIKKIGGGVLELGVCTHAFWSESGAKYREENPRTSDEKGSRLKEAILKAPYARVTWLASIFLLGYVGAEVALGGESLFSRKAHEQSEQIS